jgi:diguanylate cyclase (GGDEF)-like protein
MFANLGSPSLWIATLVAFALAQRLWHAVRRSQWQAQFADVSQSLESALDELSQCRSALQGTQVENLVLCDLLAEADSDIALRRLLQSFVPINSAGVAAYFRRHEGWMLHDAVGIDRRQGHAIHIDPRLLGALGQSRSVILDGSQLELLELGRSLLAATGEHLDRLYLFRTSPIGEALDGVIVTSSLPEAGGSEAERVRIVERLVAAAGRYFHRSAMAAAQEQELRMTREILELRSVVDMEFSSPQEMVDQFLGRLAAVCEFEHAGVYLLRRRDGVLTRLSSSSGAGARTPDVAWETAERRIAEAALTDEFVKTHVDGQLRKLPFDVPFRSAVTVPMRIDAEPAGVLCLSGLRPAALADADHELLHWSGEFLLDTILKSVDRASIEARASLDALTGLANRHAFDDALAEYIERARITNRECALILIDLDHFKRINDRYGHPAGDEALRTVAALILEELRLHVRGTDHPLAARYGGEEVAVLLPHIGLAGALRVAERIRLRVAQNRIETQAGAFQVTLSAGVAVAPTQATTADDLVQAADNALYKAKRTGRDRVLAAFDDTETVADVAASSRVTVTAEV